MVLLVIQPLTESRSRNLVPRFRQSRARPDRRRVKAESDTKTMSPYIIIRTALESKGRSIACRSAQLRSKVEHPPTYPRQRLERMRNWGGGLKRDTDNRREDQEQAGWRDRAGVNDRRHPTPTLHYTGYLVQTVCQLRNSKLKLAARGAS